MSGTVRDADDNVPIAGICVEAWLEEEPDGTPVASAKPTATATTNQKGDYMIASLPAGHYLVIFQPCAHPKPATKDFALTRFGATPSSPAHQELVRVLEGTPTTAINASMSRGATLLGRVLDPNGQPLADICVQAFHDFSTPASVVVRSDKAGRFQLRGVTQTIGEIIGGNPQFPVLVSYSDCAKKSRFEQSYYEEGRHSEWAFDRHSERSQDGSGLAALHSTRPARALVRRRRQEHDPLHHASLGSSQHLLARLQRRSCSLQDDQSRRDVRAADVPHPSLGDRQLRRRTLPRLRGVHRDLAGLHDRLIAEFSRRSCP
jgi:hypothetical protein